jgi:hypothetical protein
MYIFYDIIPDLMLYHVTYTKMYGSADRLCGLAVRVPGYRSRGPGTIPYATGFSEK